MEEPMKFTVTAAKDPQHMQALAQANRVRLARAELKRRISSGDRSAVAVIIECPWEAETMSVAAVLMSQRRWGHTRCRKFLASIPISENKTVGSMTERQRQTLAALLTAKPGQGALDTGLMRAAHYASA
jgi:hypothetical protein